MADTFEPCSDHCAPQGDEQCRRPMAERYGVAKVKWRLAGEGPEFVPRPIDVGKFSGATEGA